MENELIYQEGSDTIRQDPQNYLIAHREDGVWKCEPDLACDRGLANKVFNELLNYDSKYCKGGDELLSKITKL
jgi:hypothetical protein